MEDSIEYDQRYCAFVDILGFSQLINQSAPPAVLRDLLRIAHAPAWGDHTKSFSGSDLKAQSISDALCLSASQSASGLAHLFYSLESLSLRLLEEGYFVRGAIVKGDLYHDPQMVFGDALVRAYRFEHEVARYPRIVVTRDVVVDANSYVEGNYGEFAHRLHQASDGPYFLHLLNSADIILIGTASKRERESHVKRYNRMAEQIQRRFDESVDNPRHFEKVQWLAKYWNRTLDRYRDEVKQIVGPGASVSSSI